MQLDQSGDVQLHRTALASVAAGGTGDLIHQRRHDFIRQQRLFGIGQRGLCIEGVEIVQHLIHIGHAAEYNLHAVEACGKAQRRDATETLAWLEKP